MNPPRTGTPRAHTGIWTALLAVLLALVPVSASASPGGHPGGNPGGNHGLGQERRSARATAALQAAEALFRGGARATLSPGTRSRGAPAGTTGRDATLVLRDLAVNMNALDATDRQVARRILARPTDGLDVGWEGVKYGDAPSTSTCDDPTQTQLEVCVHWVTDPTDPNAPSLQDDDGDGIPNWVELNQTVFHQVWQRIIGRLGYKPPRSDLEEPDHESDGRTDIYIADLPVGLYGYCAAEPLTVTARTAPAYCVLDDDYAEFPDRTPAQNLEVTAAHEFFHAVQFGYNINADTWLMEGTAAWMEDEVYTSINDNLQYLWRSALSVPYAPLDYIAPDSSTDPDAYAWRYGSWIWWRFLSEYFGPRSRQDPSVVRQVWQKVAAGQHTLPAVRNVLAARKRDFGNVFADFGAVNRSPRAWYAEGRSYQKYVPAAAGRFVLGTRHRATGWLVTKLPHLSSQSALFRPGTSLKGRWRLRVDLNLPYRYRGSRANLVVHRRDGSTKWLRARLDRRGDARLLVSFGRGSVSSVVITLTNASTRFTQCGSQTLWSCAGRPLDDGTRGKGLQFAFNARAVR